MVRVFEKMERVKGRTDETQELRLPDFDFHQIHYFDSADNIPKEIQDILNNKIDKVKA